MQESCFTVILLYNVILQASEEQIVAISKEITPKINCVKHFCLANIEKDRKSTDVFKFNLS